MNKHSNTCLTEIVRRHEAHNLKSTIHPILYSDYLNFWVLKLQRKH
jgi:hypothetical protein